MIRSRTSLVTVAALLVAFGYLLSMGWKADEPGRLYWEQSGRVLGAPFVPGYVEWVQQRVGEVPPPPSAAVMPASALAPYTEFTSEYPPGALLLFCAVRTVADDPAAFDSVFTVAMALCLMATFAFVALAFRDRVRSPSAVAIAAVGLVVWIAFLGPLAVLRFDAPVALTVAASLYAWSRSSRCTAAFVLGVGGAIKLWPLLLLPFLALARSPNATDTSGGASRLWRASGAGIAGVIGFAVPHGAMLLLGTSPADVLDYLRYMSDRPLHVESTAGNLLASMHVLGVHAVESTFSFGSHNVTSPWSGAFGGGLTAGFVALYGAVAFAAVRRGVAAQALMPLFGVVVAATIVGAKVFSGEYLIWLLPTFVYAALLRRHAIVAAVFVALLFLKFTYRNYDSALQLEPLGTAMILGKNLACVAIVVLSFCDYRASSRADGAVSRQP